MSTVVEVRYIAKAPVARKPCTGELADCDRHNACHSWALHTGLDAVTLTDSSSGEA